MRSQVERNEAAYNRGLEKGKVGGREEREKEIVSDLLRWVDEQEKWWEDAPTWFRDDTESRKRMEHGKGWFSGLRLGLRKRIALMAIEA